MAALPKGADVLPAPAEPQLTTTKPSLAKGTGCKRGAPGKRVCPRRTAGREPQEHTCNLTGIPSCHTHEGCKEQHGPMQYWSTCTSLQKGNVGTRERGVLDTDRELCPGGIHGATWMFVCLCARRCD